jgi:hypothetical protein
MTSEEQEQPAAAAGAKAAADADADADADASDEEEEGSTLMLWRREGDSWDEADSEDEAMAAEGGLISISQYSALCEQAARWAAPARPGPHRLLLLLLLLDCFTWGWLLVATL